MQKFDLEPIHKISGQVPVLVFTQLDGSSSVGSPRSLEKKGLIGMVNAVESQ